jgi:type I restriction enzyme S subunit
VIAELPQGWLKARLGDIVSRPRAKVSPADHSELPFVGMDHIASNGMSLLGSVRFGDMKSNGGLFFRDDVLYGRMRPYLNKVHRAVGDGACSAEFIVFPVREGIDSGFLAYLLHSRSFVNFACELSSGDRPRVDFDSLADYEIHVPPTLEQRRIASKIDELFSSIDGGERALERVRKLVDRYRQSVLKAAVTGELTREWREKHVGELESGEALLARILDARRQAWEESELERMTGKRQRPTNDVWKKEYPEPMPANPSELPELPVGWAWASLEQLLIKIQSGRSFSCEERPPIGEEYGVVKVSAVTWGTYDEAESKTIVDPLRVNEDYRIKHGDFLFSRANTLELVGASVIVHSVNSNYF